MGSRLGTDQPRDLSRMLRLGGISSAGRHCSTVMAAGQSRVGLKTMGILVWMEYININIIKHKYKYEYEYEYDYEYDYKYN